MQNDLKVKWDINALVLYDRPVSRYVETSVNEKHELFMRLSADYHQFSDVDSGSSCVERTSLTIKEQGSAARLRTDRPFLLISSTSWTEDEDFGILLSALNEYDRMKSSDDALPRVICIITGKGPLKDYYLNEIDRLNFENVKIITPWLSTEDYQLLIGSADLGVCLHTSSSGLDLPMKVVDMFSCRVPVCAVGFQCLEELVVDDVNGRVFNSSSELAEQLQVLLRGFPNENSILTRYKENLKVFQNSTWDIQWSAIARPVFQR